MALTGIGAIDEDAHTTLDDRPWELLERGGLVPRKTAHATQFLASRPLRDTGSIPIALFDPKIKPDIIPDCERDSGDISEGELESDTWEAYASERNMGDGLAGEPLVAKQVASLSYAGQEDATADEIILTASKSPLLGLEVSSADVAPVPRLRRMSARLAQASGSDRDPMTVEEEDDGEDSDEDDGPAAKRSRTVSKRPTTGGKAPARKTIGGKSVARKLTAGKSVRKTTSAKAPRTGRRKSIVE